MHRQTNFFNQQKYRIVDSYSSAQTSHKQKSLKLSVSTIAIVRVLSIIGLCLIIASTMGQLYQRFISQERFRRLVSLLYVDAEKNIPTAYSFLILVMCSILLAIITFMHSRNRDRYAKHWQGLSVIFFVLAIDEFCSIHELATHITRNSLKTSGIFYFAWVIPGMAFLSIFILAYLKFVLALPRKTQLGFIISGSVFVFGAIGMELIGGYFFQLHGSDNLIYIMNSTVEEMLEMSGIIIFIYNLLEYIKIYIVDCTFSITD